MLHIVNMIPSVHFLLAITQILPTIVDWLDSIENDEDFNALLFMNFLNILSLIVDIFNAAIDIFEGQSVYELHPNNLIHFLLGYR